MNERKNCAWCEYNEAEPNSKLCKYCNNNQELMKCLRRMGKC